MRSRSSRLFIVLLHLVGVSTNLPTKLWDWNVGIVGAHPMAILLERLELESAGGLDGLLRRLKGAGHDVDELLGEPFWLQVSTVVVRRVDMVDWCPFEIDNGAY
mmetsp:Transcript_49304/g.148439  ORF Transcript_49304/g.148439 Transcript_49304/m.148439 type:complete len:104 (+) Transcript_49304:547-858(+)